MPLRKLHAAFLSRGLAVRGDFWQLDACSGWVGVLVARNVLWVVAAALSCWRVISASAPGRDDPDAVPAAQGDSPALLAGHDFENYRPYWI